VIAGLDDVKIEGVDVSGLGVALLVFSVGRGTKWRAVIHIDERATPDQHDALLKLVTGQLGGAFAELATLIGEVTAIERSPIRIDLDGHNPQYGLAVASGDADTERAAIERTVLDYFEGWFNGDPVCMERALHPELVKRSLEKDPSGGRMLRTITAEEMIEATARGEGKDEDPGDLRIAIEVEDVLGELANVTVRSAVYIEYLHLARTSDGWKIVNDVWQPTPAPAE
jgi:hypothetical protein